MLKNEVKKFKNPKSNLDSRVSSYKDYKDKSKKNNTFNDRSTSKGTNNRLSFSPDQAVETKNMLKLLKRNKSLDFNSNSLTPILKKTKAPPLNSLGNQGGKVTSNLIKKPVFDIEYQHKRTRKQFTQDAQSVKFGLRKNCLDS